MTRAVRLALIAVGIVVAVVLVALAAPRQQHNADYCYSKGGFYNYKSMQCFHDGQMENLIWKDL